MPRLTRDLPALLAAVVLGFGAAGCGEEDAENAAQDASETVEQNAPEAEATAEDAAEDAAREAEENAPEVEQEAEEALNEAEQQLQEEK